MPGRWPRDKFIVRDEAPEASVKWGPGGPWQGRDVFIFFAPSLAGIAQHLLPVRESGGVRRIRGNHIAVTDFAGLISRNAVSGPFRAVALLRDPAKVDSLNRISQSRENAPNVCERVLQHHQHQRQGCDASLEESL
jgi:hypothetical protein